MVIAEKWTTVDEVVERGVSPKTELQLHPPRIAIIPTAECQALMTQPRLVSCGLSVRDRFLSLGRPYLQHPFP